MNKYRIVEIQDAYNIIINGGAKNGILPNQQFIVYSLDGKELFDPETNESLGHLETVKGTGTVTFLEDKWCRITSDRYRKYTAFDKLTEVPSVTRTDLVLTTSPDYVPVEEIKVGDSIQLPFHDLSKDDIVKPT